MSEAPVKVLMLGWEFPPFITGGLGTACHGLTKALDELGAKVTFVLPKSVSGDAAAHVRLVAPGMDSNETEQAPGIRLEDLAARGLQQAAASSAGGALPPPAAPSGSSTGAGSPATAGSSAQADARAATESAVQASATAGAGHVEAAPAPATWREALARAASAGSGVQHLGRSLRLLTLPLFGDAPYTSADGFAPMGSPFSATEPRALRAAALYRAATAGTAPQDGRSKLDDLLHGLADDARREVMTALEAWEQSGGEAAADVAEFIEMLHAVRTAVPEAGGRGALTQLGRGGTTPDYSGDLLAQAEAYARFCVETCRDQPFDVIHAHDWLTYPAGIALARVTGRPLVVHVHSTEFDRSGTHVNQPVYNIERRGMHSAVRVVTVSMLTRNICHNRYGVPLSKCDVVYNGVELDPKAMGMRTIEKRDKVVLYFGRITMQKGPEYFVHAARRVLDVMDDVKFVVAGSGDQAQRMIELAASLDIGHKMLFTGFLRGRDIQRVFQIADLYVMPSVSEPFGIAPLEALGNRVPVLISRQSGVSEVLQNALKFDFWDTEDLANKIVAVLRHPPLQRTLREEGFDEVRGITWEGAARKTLGVYRKAIGAVARARA